MQTRMLLLVLTERPEDSFLKRTWQIIGVCCRWVRGFGSFVLGSMALLLRIAGPEDLLSIKFCDSCFHSCQVGEDTFGPTQL